MRGDKARQIERTHKRRKYNSVVDGRYHAPETAKSEMARKPYGTERVKDNEK